MQKSILTATEAERLVTKVGPSLGCDFTYGAVFPEGRSDVCAVRRLAEDGSDYGFDTLYLVWKDKEDKVHYREIANSRGSKDYVNIDAVTAEGDSITIEYGSGGSFSGKAWKDRKVLRLE